MKAYENTVIVLRAKILCIIQKKQLFRSSVVVLLWGKLDFALKRAINKLIQTYLTC